MMNYDMGRLLRQGGARLHEQRPEGRHADRHGPVRGIQYCGVGGQWRIRSCSASSISPTAIDRLVEEQYETAKRWLEL